jgi:hypothetical protein
MPRFAQKNGEMAEQAREDVTDQRPNQVTGGTARRVDGSGSPDADFNGVLTAGRSRDDNTLSVTVLLHGQWILSGFRSGHKDVP